MLELHNVVKRFTGEAGRPVLALDHLSLRAQEGSFVAVIGTNGSGKSTLQGAIAGSIAIDSGSIRIAGVDVTQWPEHRRASMIGRVFQNPFSGTAPTLTVAENLVLAARRGQPRGLGWALGRRAREQMRERIAGLGMGLENRLDTAIGLLSGGQRQALTLLMATLVRPKLLLLDEHTAALDPKSADQVVRLTRQIVERERLTAFMVTHSMHHAATVGDRLLMMHQGRIILDCEGAAKRRLRADELLRRFEDLRRRELLDEGAAELIRAAYV
jgi:putative ABC transport system ATP-binding protein